MTARTCQTVHAPQIQSEVRGMTEPEYIEANYSMFGYEEMSIECRTVKVVTVRKPHDCACPAHGSNPHVIPVGARAVADRAIADGAWGTCYVCLPCLESWWNHCEKHTDYCTVRSAEELRKR